MNSSYCLNMSLCNNHENNETNISFYNILLNACAKGTCLWLNTLLGTIEIDIDIVEIELEKHHVFF